MKNIALIGSTGSVGRQVLKVVKNHPDKFRVSALVANRPSAEFSRQTEEFAPEFFALASEDKSRALAACALGSADIVFNAAAGFAGLGYSLEALKAGKPLALANKETLVCGGEAVARFADARIIPVDSEHSAIWQCLAFDAHAPLRRLVITASGGAFRGYSPEMLEGVTPAQALAHPTWKMGAKITVDSATLINKGYEVIEAHALYGTPYSRIDTVIQPQSIVHSMVEFEDGAVLAQMSYPTMELPIQLALTYPERLSSSLAPMDFKRAFSIDFEPMERGAYPLFDLAVKCGEEGGTLPCAMNAADEVAVRAFLDGRIGFTDIYRVVERVVSATARGEAAEFGVLEETDRAARAAADSAVRRIEG